MKRGLVIGKFLPIHKGHIALIEFAASQCDEVIVSMSYTPQDPIDPEQRFTWIQDLFAHNPAIKPAMVLDNFDDESLPIGPRTERWAAFIKKTYPPTDVVFSSEPYGEPFATHLGAQHISFDSERKNYPVSGSAVREHPFRYWDYIPDNVKPYFVKKICFYGPESTGKSTMAKRMAGHYHTVSVPEVARELITSNEFNREDIIMIGRKQTERIFKQLRQANKLLFCDTDLITTQIYSRHYLKVVPPILYEFEKMVQYDQYFLFDIDVPWVSDGLRDLGEEKQRRNMFELFKDELERRKIEYIMVSGSYHERESRIIEYCDKLIEQVS
ncbi:MAG: AAA family ATPase [Cyclobacteriaceae bacterium]|nr:AAA family ATPase [Cyclobacteriaceae bacterium]UYN87351.1 MAG: AAA family ATPase [Cyclobacteriaceae bacterium]